MGYALDAGASIIVPQVNTVAEAQHIVSAAKFGARQRGTRSAPPYRLIPGVTDACIDKDKTIHENLNEQAAIVIQIESLEAINNLDAILTEVPEVDAVWLGTIDCRVSMGLHCESGRATDEPEWTEAVAKFRAIVRKHNKPSGGFALGSPERMRAMGQGKALIFVAIDVAALMSTVDELKQARQLFPAEPLNLS